MVWSLRLLGLKIATCTRQREKRCGDRCQTPKLKKSYKERVGAVSRTPHSAVQPGRGGGQRRGDPYEPRTLGTCLGNGDTESSAPTMHPLSPSVPILRTPPSPTKLHGPWAPTSAANRFPAAATQSTDRGPTCPTAVHPEGSQAQSRWMPGQRTQSRAFAFTSQGLVRQR